MPKKTTVKSVQGTDNNADGVETVEMKELPLTVECPVCNDWVDPSKMVMTPYKEIVSNINVITGIAKETIQTLGICKNCNTKYTSMRCKYLAKDGSGFCSKLKKHINILKPDMCYCLHGYRVAQETPKLECHSQFEHIYVLKVENVA